MSERSRGGLGVKADARTSRYWPGQSFEMLLFFGWLLSVPYYWLRAHGRKGLPSVLKFAFS